MTFHRRTKDAARNQWRGILRNFGVPAEALTNRHGPCPMCGGHDRFRFDNRDGDGTWICNGCGAGDGMALAMKFTGREFADVAAEVDKMLGNETFEKDRPRETYSPDRIAAMLREVAQRTTKIAAGDVVDRYLHSRGIGETHYPKALRTAVALSDGDGGVRPAMVATIRTPNGQNISLHRTFLRHDGSGKAEMADPRKNMPGTLPDGACVWLTDEWTPGPIGIAEGIETAMAASIRFEMPVWAALNATMLEKWTPPEGATEVAVFGDHDANFRGQAAAYRLAHRLACRPEAPEVSVHIPPMVGDDWNTVLLRERQR